MQVIKKKNKPVKIKLYEVDKRRIDDALEVFRTVALIGNGSAKELSAAAVAAIEQALAAVEAAGEPATTEMPNQLPLLPEPPEDSTAEPIAQSESAEAGEELPTAAEAAAGTEPAAAASSRRRKS